MGGFSVVVLMSILSFIYLFFIAIFVAVILYIIMSYKYLLGKIAGNKIMGAISGILSFIAICLGTRFYINKELEIVLFIILVISLIITFILDTMIAHRIYKSRTNKYGDILTVFNILSLGLLRPIFLFIIRNKNEQCSIKQ